jgi:hypothetical protein
MGKLAEAFQIWVARKVSGHGSVGRFCEDSGFSRSTVENWRDGASIPKLDALDKLIEKRVLRLEEIAEPAQDAHARALEQAKAALDAASAALTQPHAPTHAHAYLLALAARLDEKKAADFAAEIRAYLEGRGISLEGIHEPVESAKKAR